MHIFIIGNPKAGLGQTQSRIAALTAHLEKRAHSVETFLTARPGDAVRCACLAGDRVDRIVVAGGDGTINEVLNGLADPSRIPLVHFPCGTANIIARELGLPSRPQDLVDVIERGQIVWADMGLAGLHRFLLLATVGFDSMVIEELKNCRGRRLGYRGYVEPILRVLRNYRPVELEVTVDGKSAHGYLAMVLKVQHYGGIFVFEKRAGLTRGHFQVLVFPKGSIPSLLRYAVGGLLRQDALLPDVVRLAGRRVTITSSEPCAVEVDGEYFGTTPVEIDLLPGIVPLVSPG